MIMVLLFMTMIAKILTKITYSNCEAIFEYGTHYSGVTVVLLSLAFTMMQA